MARPNVVYLYRITHIDNLNFIVASGRLTCSNHANCDPNFIGIGDSTLIESRNLKQIPLTPKGNFNNYVAFYFGPRSPMLYTIQNGFNNVKIRQPQEIIYLVTTFTNVIQNESQYVFTDGHGYHKMSQFFDNEKGLEEVDWNIVAARQWTETEDDPDRKRRKQAEFLVYQELPITALHAIVVYDQATKEKVLAVLTRYDFNCNVVVHPKSYY